MSERFTRLCGRTLENNIKTTHLDIATMREHAKSALKIAEKVEEIEQKVIKKEAEVRYIFCELDSLTMNCKHT